MIAKLIVWDETRAQALARMRGALGDTRIVGVANNVAFLGRLVSCPAFTDADLDTALIERQQQFLFPEHQEPGREVWLAAAVATLARAGARRRALALGDDGRLATRRAGAAQPEVSGRRC